MGHNKGRVAYVEDAASGSDENQTVRDSRQSASIKRKDKKTREERHKEKRKSRSGDGIIKVDKKPGEETIADEVGVIPDQKESRHRSQKSEPITRSPRKCSRPPPTSRVTFDNASSGRPNKDDPRYFGRRQDENVVMSPSKSSRPPLARQMRPMSGHGIRAAHPPVSRSASFHPPPGVHSPTPIIKTYSLYGKHMQPIGYDAEYFDGPAAMPQVSHLADRFRHAGGAITQPASSSGYRRASQQQIEYAQKDYEDDDYDDETDYEVERLEKARQAAKIKQAEKEAANRIAREVTKQLQDLQDRDAMPPPSANIRPQSSLRHNRDNYLPYPDAKDLTRRDNHNSVHYVRRDSFDTSSRPRITHAPHTDLPIRCPRREGMRRAQSTSVDYEKVGRHRPDIQMAGSNGRRSSFYGGTSGTPSSATSTNYEDKARAAMGYQDEVQGFTPGLTAEALRQQQRTIASSRSTRSSGSRDVDSERPRSVTTKTTRSGGDDGNATTFTVKGNAVVEIGGSRIQTTEEQGPVEVTTRETQSGMKAIGNGSEVASSYAASQLAFSASDERRLRQNSHRDSYNYGRSASRAFRDEDAAAMRKYRLSRRLGSEIN